jgi:hypothetical protein
LLPSFVFCRLPSSSSSRLFTIHTTATPSFISRRFGCELRLRVHAVSCAVAVVPRRRSETWQQPQAAGGLGEAELIQHSSSSRGSLSLSRTSPSSFRFARLPVCFFPPNKGSRRLKYYFFCVQLLSCPLSIPGTENICLVQGNWEEFAWGNSRAIKPWWSQSTMCSLQFVCGLHSDLRTDKNFDGSWSRNEKQIQRDGQLFS